MGVGEALPPPPPRLPVQPRGPRGERDAGTLRPARPGPLAAGHSHSAPRTHKVTAASQPSHQGPPAASYRWTAPTPSSAPTLSTVSRTHELCGVSLTSLEQLGDGIPVS